MVYLNPLPEEREVFCLEPQGEFLCDCKSARGRGQRNASSQWGCLPSVKGKLAASLREWRNGLSLLSVKHDDIRPENKELQKLYASFIIEEKREETLDPRL